MNECNCLAVFGLVNPVSVSDDDDDDAVVQSVLSFLRHGRSSIVRNRRINTSHDPLDRVIALD